MSSQFSGDFSVATYNNLANRNSFTGSDQQHNLYTTTDPFVNSAAGDYRLKNPSAPIDYGIVVPGLITTYTGAGARRRGHRVWQQQLDRRRELQSMDLWQSNYRAAVGGRNGQVRQHSEHDRKPSGGQSDHHQRLCQPPPGIRAVWPAEHHRPDRQGHVAIYETSGANNANGSVNLYQLTSSSDGTFAGLANGSLVGTGWDAEGLELYNEIDVTAIVAGWLANPSSNYGFSLIGSESGDNRNTAKYFDGFYGVTSPQLVVTYTVPEPGILALLGTGLTALLAYPMRRRKEDRMSGGGSWAGGQAFFHRLKSGDRQIRV